MPRPSADTLRALAAALLLPLVALWPLPLVRGQGLLSAPGQEAADHLFGLWAARRAGDWLVVETTQVEFPEGLRFVLVDPLHLPVYALGEWVSPSFGYNLVLYVGLVVSALGVGLLTRRLGGQAWVGAALGAWAPPLVSSVSEGQTENFALGWVAIQLWLLLRYLDTGKALWGAGAALGLAACFYGGPYNGVFAALLSAAVGLWWVRRRPGVLAVGAGALALVMPLALAILGERFEHLPGSSARAELPPPTGLLHGFRGGLRHGVDLSDPFFPAFLTGGTHEIAHTGYLGLSVLLLAGLTLWRRRELWPWVAGAAAFVGLSLGFHLYLGGEALRIGGHAVLAPVGVLTSLVPELGRLSRWYRAAGVAFLLLAPLAALACRPRWLVGIVLVDLLWLSPVPWPHPVVTSRFGEALSELEGPGALLEVPHHQDHPTRRPDTDENLYAATFHGRPLSGSFLGIPGWLAKKSEYMALQRVGQSGGDATAPLRFFYGEGFRWLAWYPEYARLSPQGRRALDAALGQPVIKSPELVVWRVGP
ncbi:MAG: hypothetical protein H6741_23845 [Alphaproteobacteria bacterium]|nr:hypothetical protein [Alphaproteobacteria bacterium]